MYLHSNELLNLTVARKKKKSKKNLNKIFEKKKFEKNLKKKKIKMADSKKQRFSKSPILNICL